MYQGGGSTWVYVTVFNLWRGSFVSYVIKLKITSQAVEENLCLHPWASPAFSPKVGAARKFGYKP
jgi:hypothetical protein